MLDLRLDQIRFDTVGGLPVVEARGPKLVGYNWHLKRIVDLAGSILLLVVLSPIWLVAYLLVVTTSRGPGIYRQARIGLHGEPFTMYKFRTMTNSNDPTIHENAAVAWVYGDGYAGNTSEAAYKKPDSRVTAIGKALRATSIDELPQLWNVAMGDMSLVGPRPPMGYEVEQYTERDRRRLDVPPGVTGLWQVSGRNSLSFDEMVDLDLDYIDSWSVALDVSILLRTLPAVVIDRGK
jgi:lipopolysaccharide/colanic/teichoic acid biosynthesis glycosyltransferase